MFTLNCKGRLLVIDRPVIMGIINTTPDSFFSGSRKTVEDELIAHAEKMIADGASILDLGGQSTRPGSVRISADEESARVIPAIRTISSRFPETILSIDSFYASVASDAVDAGASIINDISAGTFDSAMIGTAAALKTPYVCMHMKGIPANMQEKPVYENVLTDVFDFLSAKVAECRTAGISDVIIDPGFGFGKSIADNFILLQNLAAFQILDCPILLGLSRKGSIYKTLNVEPSEALNGTTVANTVGLLNGASILRVHDVKEAVQAVQLIAEIKKVNGLPFTSNHL
ncbi:MAG: dihydropteroate synthase [Gemmatimonadaceae bacterium]|nr:dihydropteroate synthase [Chitinophagaceae bacterium]